jgi:hypothetical protein
MLKGRHMKTPTALPGLRGDHPAGFLATLGLLAVLQAAGNPRPRASWTTADTPGPLLWETGDSEAITETVMRFAHQTNGLPAWHSEHGAPNVAETTWRALTDALAAKPRYTPGDDASWLALASDLTPRTNGKVSPSELITLSGQQTLDNVLAKCRQRITGTDGRDTVRLALRGPWRYERGQGLSLGLDPSGTTDAAIHGKDPDVAGVPAITWLAAWGLTALPTFGYLDIPRATTALHGPTNDRRLAWPLWSQPLALDAVRVLLSTPHIGAALEGNDQSIADLANWGVMRLVASRRTKRDVKGDYYLFTATDVLPLTQASAPVTGHPRASARTPITAANAP